MFAETDDMRKHELQGPTSRSHLPPPPGHHLPAGLTPNPRCPMVLR